MARVGAQVTVDSWIPTRVCARLMESVSSNLTASTSDFQMSRFRVESAWCQINDMSRVRVKSRSSSCVESESEYNWILFEDLR